MLGLEDSMFDRNHTATVKCSSSTGLLYAIKKNEFIFKFQRDQKTWDLLKNMAEVSDLALSEKQR